MSSAELSVQPEALFEALAMVMPIGKYSGRRIIELPEPYLVWFNAKGLPAGKLGKALALAYEVKLNGLERELTPLVARYINEKMK